MKRAMVVVLVAALLVSAIFIGCRGTFFGSGNLETRQYDLSDFSRVEVGSAFDFEIIQSGSYSVSVTADDNAFEYIEVAKRGDTLQIGMRIIPGVVPTTLEAVVTLPQLRGLVISGASEGYVTGFSSTENIEIRVSGASKVAGDITAGDAEFDVSGASTVRLEGSADDMDANVSGASSFKLGDFMVNNADVVFSGASSGTVNVTGRLDANLSGASKLDYIGEPTMGDINTSGASTLSKK